MLFVNRDAVLLRQSIDRGLETRKAPLNRIPQVAASSLVLRLAQMLARHLHFWLGGHMTAMLRRVSALSKKALPVRAI